MSLLAMSSVWQLAPASWSPARRLVALAIADHVSDEDGTAWPSLATLAELTGLERRQVRRHVSALVEDGWVVREARYVDGGQRSNLFGWARWVGRLEPVGGCGQRAVDNTDRQLPLVTPVTGGAVTGDLGGAVTGDLGGRSPVTYQRTPIGTPIGTLTEPPSALDVTTGRAAAAVDGARL